MCVKIKLHAYLTFSLDGGEWSASRSALFVPLGKEPQVLI